MIIQSGIQNNYRSPAVRRKTTAYPTMFATLLGGARSWLLTCGERRRQRVTLATFDDRMLADLGLSRGDVSSEVEKWPWQI
jgi:uncharacterized protein YjiS (DUF1127 family)